MLFKINNTNTQHSAWYLNHIFEIQQKNGSYLMDDVARFLQVILKFVISRFEIIKVS